MTPPITIRQLAYSDLPQVISVERRSFPTPWSLAMFVLELSKPSGICLAAAAGRHIYGYLICSRYDQAFHLMNIAVEPSARRAGIGRDLVHEMIERAGRDRSFTLEVRTSNAPAIRLYESFGFKSVGMRPRYYADTGEDAIIMWRTNRPSSDPVTGGHGGDSLGNRPSGTRGSAPLGGDSR